ncbi:MAG TPA: Rho termination factor N-terminal domain-containing protein [Pseudogracilibacillus sp.]|nr:Rho termination factor N-terminal domain-containing protein [Pseudogracilibacillus sp.]
MTKYIAQAYLSHKGNIVKPGEEIELTKEQSERLGDKVNLVSIEKQTGEKELSEHTVDELKGIAEKRGLEDYSKLKKDELVALIEDTEQEQE